MSGSTLESRGDHVTKVKSWRFSASKRVENGAGCCWRMNCAIPFFIFLVIWVILFSEILKWVDQTVMEHNGEEKSVAATREANGRCIHYYLLHPHMPLSLFASLLSSLVPSLGKLDAFLHPQPTIFLLDYTSPLCTTIFYAWH